jgi:hypothetical protein
MNPIQKVGFFVLFTCTRDLYFVLLVDKINKYEKNL